MTNVVISRSDNATYTAVSDLAFTAQHDADNWQVAAIARYYDTLVDDGGRMRLSRRVVKLR